MKVLTFGEIMLRLKAPGHERFFQSPMLESPAISTGARRLRAWTGFTSRESHPQSRNLQWN